MDREKEIMKLDIPEQSGGCSYWTNLPESEVIDFWEEGSEYIIYNKWDKVFEWFRKVWNKIDRW